MLLQRIKVKRQSSTTIEIGLYGNTTGLILPLGDVKKAHSLSRGLSFFYSVILSHTVNLFVNILPESMRSVEVNFRNSVLLVLSVLQIG